MIQFNTYNKENHIAIGIPDNAHTPHILLGGKIFVLQENSIKEIFNIKDHNISKIEILGIFDKSKNEIDFSVNGNLKNIQISGIYNNTDSIVKDYLELLQLVTKDSKFNKFVILKQL